MVKRNRLKPEYIAALCIAALCTALPLCPRASADDLRANFAAPPAAARPWVYWFWLNGNITKPGITADLEAMQRVGIGGVLIMEVDQGTPLGPVAFGGPKWREMFQFVCSEAHRLGLQVNMNNDAGWCGSAGPWITPALSMQKVVWSETTVIGQQHLEMALPQPETVANYYQDIAVLAEPTPDDDKFRISDIRGKSALDFQEFPAPPAVSPAVPAAQTIDPAKIVNLTAQSVGGRLTWNVPPGKWTILRFGHTSTGVANHPAPQSGLGLETDKLSRAATEAQFKGLIAHLTADNKPFVGQTLVSTHIDSWETGSQNWTPTFREDFRRLRGYDPFLYLPVMTGRVVGSLDLSERFLWDVRQTVSDLLVANYAGYLRELAHQQGIRLSIEGYTAPTDELAYTAQADEPMAEFWSSPMYSASKTVPLMASAGHTNGKNIIGAEAFTANSNEKWRLSPASIKSLGDWAFCNGINRFVIHRYAMQPFLNVKPGVSMGPWGLHYERTETWWEQSKPWHEYLARCQYLLRQGRFAADICYLEPEGSPHHFTAPDTFREYKYDDCDPEVVLEHMTLKNGLLTLPDGMQYRLLALPDAQTMTPKLLAKIAALVEAGATVVGPPPVRSPSLSAYPECDAQVRLVAQKLWGGCDGKTVLSHAYGKGRVVWGRTPAEVLSDSGLPADFSCAGNPNIHSLHRQMADGTDLYFVANTSNSAKLVSGVFRVQGKTPEFWWPETGRVEPVAEYVQRQKTVAIPLHLTGTQSVFVVFRSLPGGKNSGKNSGKDHVVSLTHNGAPLESAQKDSLPVITRAVYGVLSDPARTRNVQAKLQALIAGGGTEFQVAALAVGDDPAYGTVKTLQSDYTLKGHMYHVEGHDPDTLNLGGLDGAAPASALAVLPGRGLRLLAWQDGKYQVRMASGKTLARQVTAIPDPREISGPWTLAFPPGSGAPAQVRLDHLLSWDLYDNPEVRDFSGTATYRTNFALPAGFVSDSQAFSLNLGDVQVIADVTLNGKDLGILWKPPYRMDISQAIKPGVNTLQIRVTNLWINRMIGDQALPEDSDRNGNGTLKAWPAWVLDGKSSPTGRKTFTSWRLWGKDALRQPSGLLGPVTLSLGKEVRF